MKKEEQQQEKNVRHEAERDIKTLLSWHAPGRPFRKKGSEFYLNAFIILLAFEAILLLFHWYMLMLAIAALGFLVFALSSVPPQNFFYRLSTQGVMVEDRFFLWSELYDFYFSKKNGNEILHIGTKAYFPGELLLMLGDIPTDHVRDIMIKYLPYREYVKPDFVDKAGDWIERNFPLENVSATKKK